MDPQVALDRFNDSSTVRAERVELAEALLSWLQRGGFAPEGQLDPDLVEALHRHYELSGHAAACAVNRILQKP